MNEKEQEIIRRVLIELFLATPRKKIELHQRESIEGKHQEISNTDQRTINNKQRGRTHG